MGGNRSKGNKKGLRYFETSARENGCKVVVVLKETDTLLRVEREERCPMVSVKSRQHYPEEFRADAVKLVLEGGYTCAEAGRRLGISANNVSKWVRLHRREAIESAGSGVSSRELEAENRRLRQEIKRLEMEREILKKAAAFFANESN